MTGRAEVSRLKQRLDATFSRARKAGEDLELQSDLACYLCVLVSGFLEQAIIELVLQHARTHAAVSVQRYVESRIRRLTNMQAQRVRELLGAFDPEWGRDLDTFLADERRDAVDSVVALRNAIAHGQSVGLTLSRITGYYGQVNGVINHIADLCDPA